MKRGDKVIIRNHPECNNVQCEIDEYEIKGRVFLHARNQQYAVLLAITSPENEPWDFNTLRLNNDGTTEYEAIWRREKITLQQFEEI